MSPHAALASETFRNYFFIVAGVLAAAGLVLAMMKWVFRKDVASVAATYRSLYFPCLLLSF